jgi:hypothetical protein
LQRLSSRGYAACTCLRNVISDAREAIQIGSARDDMADGTIASWSMARSCTVFRESVEGHAVWLLSPELEPARDKRAFTGVSHA